jgi:hypothetical protein
MNGTLLMSHDTDDQPGRHLTCATLHSAALGKDEAQPPLRQATGKTRHAPLRYAAMVGLFLLGLMVLASCSTQHAYTGKVETEQQEDGSAGFGGQTYTVSTTTTSTVVSVDVALRTLQLKQPDGTITNYKAGPEVVNLEQVKVGDRVETTLAEARTVGFAAAGTQLSSSDKSNVVHSPDGGPVIAVNTRTLTAKVLSVNLVLHSVTLQVADGKTMTVTANPNTNLAIVNAGDEVSVKVSEARTFRVLK